MDPISDLLNRIRNAQAVEKPSVEIPFSNLKYEISRILEKEGFVSRIEKKGKKVKKTIEIVLKYDGRQPAITGLKMVSKPGQRVYRESKKISAVKGGFGIAIVSTSKGLMTDRQARKERIGGELIARVW